jgi:CubicO group peptidase (beta-lactamase class C family)
VRRYVPELRLTDEWVVARVTVLHLLNHTAGLDSGFIADFEEGDDALAANVARLAELELITPPGGRASYSQAGYNLAGPIVEKVTGLTYERPGASLVLEPLALQHSFFARDDVMTRRFAVGHNRGEDGTLSIARRWRRPRGGNPGGGLVSSVANQRMTGCQEVRPSPEDRERRALHARSLTRSALEDKTHLVWGSANVAHYSPGWART